MPGMKLVEKRTNRKWLDEGKVIEALKAEGKTDEEIYKTIDPQLNGITAIEKLMGKNWVKPFAYKPLGELTMALESDKRPATTRAHNDFSDIEIQPEITKK